MLLVRKIKRRSIRFLKHTYQRAWAVLCPTYLTRHWDVSRNKRVLNSPCFARLEILPPDVNSVVEHTFDLLGSGPVNVCYGLNAKGFEEYKYSAIDVDFVFDEGGKWLKKFINRTNLAYSQKTWRFLQSIDSDYRPIDWQLDFKSGYRWDNWTFHANICVGGHPGSDVKVPWELSRFQHLSDLGLAHKATGEDRFAKEYVCQMLDWIATNPPMFGVNWACTMDVAIRASNWLFWFGYIRDWVEKQRWKDEFLEIFLNSLYDHLMFISKNFERTERLTTNHYLANIAGLLFIASSTETIFPESRDLKEFAISELKSEMFNQFYPDGTNFEGSTCYHRLGLEIIFYAVWWEVVRNNNFNGTNYREVAEAVFGLEFVKRLYKAFDVMLYLLKPNGQMPQIGDNDSGQFVTLWSRVHLDMRYLLGLGCVFFNDPKFKIKELFSNQDAIWEIRVLYGDVGYELWDSMNCSSLAGIKSIAFVDSGWYIMRDGNNYCIISCGPNGQNGFGGHCHNDKLSFELCVDGQDIIVDPGTFVYTAAPQIRNKFRGTACHNTVVVDGREQNRVGSKLFVLKEELSGKCECIMWQPGEFSDCFIGKHSCHQRQINFYKKTGKLEIIDSFYGRGENNFNWNLVLSPHLHRTPYIQSNGLDWQSEAGAYSKGYGMVEDTQKLSASLKKELPAQILTTVMVLND